MYVLWRSSKMKGASSTFSCSLEAVVELGPGNLGITVGINQRNDPVNIIVRRVVIPEISQEVFDFSEAQGSILIGVVTIH